MAKVQPTTRANLLAVLNDYSRASKGFNLDKLLAEERKAEEAVLKFEETNKQYRRLRELADKACKSRQEAEKKVISRIREIRHAIILKGPTPEVVKMVEDLAKELK